LTETIKVEYEVYSTLFGIRKALKDIEAADGMVSLDLETRSINTKFQRALAKTCLKENDLPIEEVNEYTRILHSSGLSHPSMIQTTHIILGLDVYKSVIFVVDERLERYVFNWLVNTDLKLIIHNASFDLKVIHHRTGKFPKNYEDTQQLAKTLINDCNNYHSRTGLKLLVGRHYPPRWSMKEETDYEVKNLKDEDFLQYCAIDGSAVRLLYNMLQKTIKEEDEKQ
jgi:DNA polymerase I-like protein with 3'-5' exonuclease and polymerase domains